MDDLEDSSTLDFDPAICGSTRTVFGTSDIECPASRFAIPDPYLEEDEKNDGNLKNEGNLISIDIELRFKFDQGKGRPPSDKEINVILEEAETFLANYLQEKGGDDTAGLYNDNGLSWFNLDNIRKHYDYANAEASVRFCLVFRRSNYNVAFNKEVLQNLVRQADVQGHLSQQIPEMTAIDHSYNVFQATQFIGYRATLV
jgi:hypothetical protein